MSEYQPPTVSIDVSWRTIRDAAKSQQKAAQSKAQTVSREHSEAYFVLAERWLDVQQAIERALIEEKLLHIDKKT